MVRARIVSNSVIGWERFLDRGLYRVIRHCRVRLIAQTLRLKHSELVLLHSGATARTSNESPAGVSAGAMDYHVTIT